MAEARFYPDFEIALYDRRTLERVSTPPPPNFLTDPTPADSVTATDSGVVMNYAQALSDSVTATDSGTVVSDAQVLADSATPTDALVVSLSTSLADSATASDAAPSIVRNLADPGLADSVTASDAAPIMSFAQALSDSVTAADSGLSNAYSQTLGDSVTVSETLTSDAASSYTLSPSDGVTASDAVPTMNFAQALADTVSPAEAMAKAFSPAALADTVTLGDGLAFTYPRSFADTATVSDGVVTQLTAQQIYTRAFNDSVTADDSTTRHRYSEGSRATYAMRRIIAAPPQILRPNIQARFSLGVGHAFALADAFGVGDALSTLQSQFTLADSFSVADVAAMSYGLQLAEAFSVADAAPDLNLFPPKPSDSVSVSDSLVFHVKPGLVDTATLSDSGLVADFQKALSDNATPTESAQFGSATWIGTNNYNLTGTTQVVTWPTGSQAGDLVLMHVLMHLAAPPSIPSGWSGQATYSGVANIAEQFYWKTLTSGDISTGSVTLTLASGNGGVAISTYRNATTPVIHAYSGGLTTTTIPGVTKTAGCRLVTSWYHSELTGQTPTVTSPTMNVHGVNNTNSWYSGANAEMLPTDYVDGTNIVWAVSASGFNAVGWIIELT